MHSFYYSGWNVGPVWSLGFSVFGIVFGLIFLIVLALKGYALWHAAKRNEKWWFVILLIVNTLGILEIIYLVAVAKVWPKKAVTAPAEVKADAPTSAPKA